MVNRKNIQVLLDQIRLENVQSYMSQNGWTFSQPEDQDVCIFSRRKEGEDYQLWLWNSSRHPKFRSRVQNIIFTLAVENSLEPIDIANDIFDSQPESTADSNLDDADQVNANTANAPRPAQVTIKNPADRSIRLGCPSKWSTTFELLPGQAINLVIEDASFVPTIEHGLDSIAIHSHQPDSYHVFSCLPQGKPDMKLIEAPSWTELLLQPKSSQWEDNCRNAWERVSFEMDGIVAQPGYEKGILKSIAVLAVAIAHELDGIHQESAQQLWLLCAKILSPFGIQIQVFPGCENELAQTAQLDRPAAPSNTLDWLTMNSRVNL